MALTENKKRELAYNTEQSVFYGTIASGVTVYRGAILEHDGSNKVQLASASTNICAGVAMGPGEAGESIPIASNHYEVFTLASAAIGDINKPVYATADDTLTLTAGTNKIFGYIKDVVDTNTVLVHVTCH